MLKSLYTAATGMEAQQTRMDVISHNLANANTTGFKKGRAEFEELLAEKLAAPAAPGTGAPTPLEVGLGVRAGATVRSAGQGDLLSTQNPLDLAIEGPGFFPIRQASGELLYTRAGNLRVDAEGRLVTAHGEVVEPDITVPQDATGLTIARDGTVTAQLPGRTAPEPLGTIELALFPNPAGLSSQGRNLFAASAASGEPMRVKPTEQGAGALAQGYLEGSNVQAVEEMIDMISTQRAYELNSKVIQTADQMLQRLTSMR